MFQIHLLDIIPLIELPPSTPDYFTYFSLKPVARFKLVKINFRGYLKVGLVKESRFLIKKEAKSLPFNLKPINSILNQPIFISEVQEKFAHWLSKNYFLSLAHSFFFLTSFFNKIKSTELPFPQPEYGPKFNVVYSQQFKEDLLNPKGINLILTPTERQAEILSQRLNGSIYLDLSLKAEKFTNLIAKILAKEKNTFIGSKSAIFFPWQKLDSIIVINEGSVFYKEHFKHPYFNYLYLISALAKILKTNLILVDDLPSLSSVLKFNLKKSVGLNFKTFSQIDELPKLLSNFTTAKIFVPTKSLGEKLYCPSCSWEYLCSRCQHPLTILENKAYCRVCFGNYNLPQGCPQCNFSLFALYGIGANWVKRYLETKGFFVVFINDLKDIKNFLKKNYQRYILVGSWLLLDPYLPNVEASFFLNFDKAFHSWNPFLKDKYLRILKELSQNNESYLQTKLDENLLAKIRQGEILEDFLQERKESFLPPFSRLIKLVSYLTNLQLLNQRLLRIKEEISTRSYLINKKVEILGPFLERIPRRKTRYQMFLLLKTGTGVDLKKLLKNIDYLEEIRADEEEL